MRVAGRSKENVRASGATLRVTAQLISSTDGTVLWSRPPDRNLSGSNDAQQKRVGPLMHALDVALDREAEHPVRSSSARDR